MPGISALENLGDDELVRRTLDGNTSAFGVLVERYQSRVIALCARITGDYTEGADLAQDAFMRAYGALDSYEQGKNFFAWLYRIAVNVALNYRNRRPPSPLPGEAGETALHELADPELTPEQRAERADLARHVQAAIAQLPPDYAATLALRYIADLDYEQIAATLRIPVGTVKARLFRAKAMLKPLLEPLYGEER